MILTSVADLSLVDTGNAALANAGLNEVEATFNDGPLSITISSLAPTTDEASDKRHTPVESGNCYLVVDDEPTSERQHFVASKLCSDLIAQGQAAKVVTISQYVQIAAVGSQDLIENSACVVLSELDAGLLIQLTEEALSFLKIVMRNKRLYWVARDESPETDLVTGFATSIRLERPKLDFTVVTVQSKADPRVVADKMLQIIDAVATAQERPETLYKVTDGLVQIPRIVQAPELQQHMKARLLGPGISDTEFGADASRSLRLQIRTIGLLDSLCFDDDAQHTKPLVGTEVEFKTMATGVNFKDLAVMLGKIQETPLDLESAGIVTRVGPAVTRFKEGDAVFGFAFNGAFSTHFRALEGSIAHIPQGLSFSQAAVIPIVYTTAYACLYDIGDLGKRVPKGRKQTVLIHAAAGGVGQAAIQLAQREGAEVFATVGSLEKRDFLEQTYGLPRDHIFSSRDTTFKAGLMRMTKGRGVDIVVNSLAGDMLRATWECLAPFGRFAEIGLTDIESRARISMGTFAKGTRFEAIELNYMQKTDMERFEDLFSRAMDSVITQGLERATPITPYSLSNIQGALRHMQSGKHIGKLVIEFDEHTLVPVVQQPKVLSKFSPDATYAVSGGFGGLGIEILKWMAGQGAKHLVVLSRQGPKSEAAQKLVADLQEKGVKIVSAMCDISDRKGLESALSKCASDMPPVRGCIHASMNLVDQVFDDMTLDMWHRGLGVKTTGTWNLWETLSSRTHDSTLDFFIMISSLTSSIGNTGQANYTAGNSYQDALARQLTSQGHNAVALDLAMMSGAGIVAENPVMMEYLMSIGWPYMAPDEMTDVLDYYCRPQSLSPTEAHVLPRVWLPQYSAAEGAVRLSWQDEPRFSHMVLPGYAAGSQGKSGSGSGSGTASRLSSAQTTQEAEAVVLDALLEKLSRVLSVDVTEINPGSAMHAYGVDSLVAVELRTWMTKEVGSDVSVFEITGGQSISQIAAKAAAGSRFVQVDTKAA